MVKKSTWNGGRRDLVVALESARTQLAVAIATERKSTSRAQWHYYLDTAERMSRFMRKLRKSGIKMGVESSEGLRLWEALQRIPPGADAQYLCSVLHDITANEER